MIHTCVYVYVSHQTTLACTVNACVCMLPFNFGKVEAIFSSVFDCIYNALQAMSFTHNCISFLQNVYMHSMCTCVGNSSCYRHSLQVLLPAALLLKNYFRPTHQEENYLVPMVLQKKNKCKLQISWYVCMYRIGQSQKKNLNMTCAVERKV